MSFSAGVFSRNLLSGIRGSSVLGSHKNRVPSKCIMNCLMGSKPLGWVTKACVRFQHPESRPKCRGAAPWAGLRHPAGLNLMRGPLPPTSTGWGGGAHPQVRGWPRQAVLRARTGAEASRLSWGPFLMPLLAWQEPSQFWMVVHVRGCHTPNVSTPTVCRSPPDKASPPLARPWPPPLLQGRGWTRDL